VVAICWITVRTVRKFLRSDRAAKQRVKSPS